MKISLSSRRGLNLLTSAKVCAEDISISVDTSSITASDIRDGVSILGVTGTAESSSSSLDHAVTFSVDGTVMAVLYVSSGLSIYAPMNGYSWTDGDGNTVAFPLTVTENLDLTGVAA